MTTKKRVSMIERNLRFLPLVLLLSCAATPEQQQADIAAKLAAWGLQVEATASLPAGLRGRAIPIRALPNSMNQGGAAQSVLPEGEASYWIVGLDGEECSLDEITTALKGWQRGERLRLRVRRDPRGQPANEWWERDIELFGR